MFVSTRLIGLAIAIVLVAAPVFARTKVGEVVAKIKGNVTGAGEQTVGLKVLSAKGDPEDPFLQTTVVIMSPQGQQIWPAPGARPGAKMVFSIGPAGVAQLQVAGDFDGDGKGEVVVEEPQSDVRPQHFSVLRWMGSGLVFVRSATLMETAPNSGRFVWKPNGAPNGRWLGGFKRIVSPGVCEADLWDGQGEPKRVTVKANADGFAIRR